MHGLPQHEARQALFARGSDDEVGVGLVLRVHVGGDVRVGEGVGEFIEGESLLIMLDMKGICGSSGSACTSGSLDPSHVLMAIGLPHEIAHGSLRLTLGADTTKEDIDYVVDETKALVERLRSMSPLYEDFVKKSQQ